MENEARGVRNAINGLDLAINGKKVLNVVEGMPDAARGLDQLGDSIKMLDRLTDGAAMLGKT